MPSSTAMVVTRAMAATLLVQALVTVAMLAVPVFAPDAAAELGVDPGYVGVYTSLVYVGAMTASLVGGAMVLRHGAIRLSQIGLVVCAGGLALVTGAHWVLFAVAAVIVGLGFGPATPASSHILAQHSPPRLMGLVFSIKQTGVPVGGVVAGLLVPFLAIEFGWRGAAWGVALMCLAGALLIQPVRREFDTELSAGRRGFRASVIAPLRLIVSSPPLRVLAFASFAFGSSQNSYIAFLVTFLVAEHGLDLQSAGLALSVAQGAGIAGRVLWGALADRVGNARLVLAGLALGMTASFVATAFYPPDWGFAGFLAIAALAGATAIGWNGVYLAEISRLAPPGEVSRATGGALFITFFGVVVVPPTLGLVKAATGAYAASFLLIAVITGIVAVALFRSLVRREADHVRVQDPAA